MKLSHSIGAGVFPAANITDTLYSTPGSNVLVAGTGYGSYDYCSMPHPRIDSYEPVYGGTLKYVEYIQRHQRRTPYNLLANDTFDCSDVNLVSGTNIFNHRGSIQIVVDNSTVGACQYPQLTAQGVQDAFTHGRDLWSVYNELGILPSLPDSTVGFRASNSKLTESSAQGVIFGLWPQAAEAVLLHQQPASLDSVNEGFSCDTRDTISDQVTASSQWAEHLKLLEPIFEKLNSTGSTTGVASSSSWTKSLDHLCDNFQAKICNNHGLDVEQGLIDKVFAGGDWEWDFKWRTGTNSSRLITTTEGLFVGEIVERLKSPASLKYWHTFAHDGDIGPLLGALGISYLRWPGMASNIAIEVWNKNEAMDVVRVLYCGAPIRSTWVQNEHPLEDFVQKLGKFILDINEC